MKNILTTSEVAKLTKTTPQTVSRWFDSGRLRGYRIPGSQDRRIPVEHLIRFLRENGMAVPEELNGSLVEGETKPVIVVWREVYGVPVPQGVCETREVAERVFGKAVRLEEGRAVYLRGSWHAPVHIIPESEADKAKKEKQLRLESAVKKAKAAGLTDEDLEALRE